MPTLPTAATPWRRTLAVVWFAELIAIVAFSVVIPLLPLYVRELGVRGEREVRLWSGLVFSVQAATMAVFSPIWGALSDRLGRKLMVERAMFSGAVLVGLMGLAQNVWHLALLRALQGALTGTITAANALVATATPRERAGYALGLLQMAIYIGASAGPLLGGVVADTLGYRATFWITGILLLLAGLGVAIFIRDTPLPSAGPGAAKRGGLRRELAPLLSSPALPGILAIASLMRTGPRLVGPTLPLFVESIAPAGARVASITGIVSGVSAAAGAVGALVLGRLGDRVGYRAILVGCAAVSAACYAPQFLVNSPAWLLPLQAGAGLAMGGIITSTSAALARLSPPGQEGIIYGVDASLASLANAIGPAVGSGLAAWVGLRAPFLGAAGVFGLAGAAVLRCLPRSSNSHDAVGILKNEEA